jgi:hypothetical protein
MDDQYEWFTTRAVSDKAPSDRLEPVMHPRYWRNWRLIQVQFISWPRSLSGWVWLIWNCDVWLGSFPLFKCSLLLVFAVSYLASALAR